MEEEILAELATGPQLKGKALKAQRAQRAREHQEFFQANLMHATAPDARATSLAAANAEQTIRAEARPSGLEMVGAALAGNTSSLIYDALFKDKHAPAKGYKPLWAELPENTDTDLLQRVSSSQSPEETAAYVQDAEDERMRVEAVMSRGVGTGIVLQFGAEFGDVTNFVAPFVVAKGLAKLGRGSDVLFQAGKTSDGYTSAITENLLSGTAIEAFKQTAQGEFKPIDLGISLVADGLIGAGTGWLSARNAANRILNSAAEEAAGRELSLVTRAEQELGQGAATEDLVAKVAELRKSDANTIIADSVTDIPKERWVMPKWNEPNSTDNLDSYTGLPNNYVTDGGEGLSQRPAPTTPEFTSWFGDSKVTNTDGTPRIVYHGTVANFDTFSHAFLGSNTGASSAREGFFFAGKPTTADAYSQGRTGSNTMAVYLNISNPLVVDLGNTARRATKYSDLVKQAKANGHDGLIIKNTVDGATVDDIHVVFDQTQIKSAIGNSGAYSPNDPRINYMATPTDATKFAAKGNEARVGREMTGDAKFTELATYGIFKQTDDFAERSAQLKAITATPGVHLTEGIAKSKEFTRYATAIEVLRKQLIPDVAIHLTDGGTGIGNASGAQGIIKPNVSMVAIKPGSGMRVVAHEFAHAVFAHQFSKLPIEKQQAMVDSWEAWKKTFDQPGDAQEAMLRRSPVGAGHDRGAGNDLAAYVPAVHGRAMDSLKTEIAKAFPDKAAADKFNDYFSNFDEYSAEQMVKQFEAIANKEADSALTLPQALLKTLIDLVQSALKVFKVAKEKGFLGADAPFKDFIEDLVAGNAAKGLDSAMPTSEVANMAVPVKPAEVVNEIVSDPDAVRFGLNLAPVNTPAERAQVQAMLALHKKAEAWEKANPFDDAWKARAKNLANNDVFNVASIGLTMLNSPSPLIRMLASELVEDASGIAGKRRNTAAISKYVLERQMMGNSINDIQNAYDVWKVGKPGANLKDEIFTGTLWDNWNTEISKEIEARLIAGKQVNQDHNVTAAVDSIQASYQRIADAERKFNTLGSEGLPKNSLGYMPHYMNPQAVMNLTNAQRQVLHSTLVDQFVTIEGWDITFADRLASKYMQRVRDRASGDYGSAMGGHGLAEVVQEALVAMQLPEDTITKHMASFHKGAPGHTKGRIKLDLNKVHSTPDGDFKLLDVFETDQIALLRKRAGSASGDVALTKHGIRGRPAVDLVRKALQYGEDGKRVEVSGREFGAFDQMIAEFRNEPFGTAPGKWLNRAMQANTLVRLGGIFYNQLAETLNGIAHIGVIRTFETIAALPRLRREIIALSKGQKVDNSIIGSIEIAGGAEFGTDAYKFVMPFDSPNHAYPSYGQDTLTATDRLLRGGGYLQGKLSGWRWLHSAQQRGMAEQVTHKMLRYIREGKDDVALQQFGVTPELRDYMKANLDNFAKFDARGKLVEFDATKITDPDMRDSVVQTVHRGVSQIIQGTFIGERGKWAHDGVMQMMTQFRTFSITSMEKQWGRQRNSRGAYGAFGLLLGTMSLSIPIYMARTYASSIGRPDQEAYLEERLAPDVVARATLNYAASSGLIGDFADLLTAPLPEEWGIKPTGGRMNQESDFVGNYIAPASSLANDIWSYAQSPLELDDAAKIMPFRNVPYLVPLFNQARE